MNDELSMMEAKERALAGARAPSNNASLLQVQLTQLRNLVDRTEGMADNVREIRRSLNCSEPDQDKESVGPDQVSMGKLCEIEWAIDCINTNLNTLQREADRIRELVG